MQDQPQASQNLNAPNARPKPGQKPKKPLPKGVKIVLIVLAALIVLGTISNCSKNKDEQDTSTPTTSQEASKDTAEKADTATEPESKPAAAPEKTDEELAAETAAQAKKDATLRNGTYKVGSEMPAGQYYLEGSGYFAIMSDSSGSLDAIIANDNYNGNSIVDVEEGQYFQFKGTQMYPIEYAETTDRAEYKDGMYRVGIDMPAGEYKIESKTSMGYIEVDTDATHTLDSIITNDIIESSSYLTVSEGQYVKLSGTTATVA